MRVEVEDIIHFQESMTGDIGEKINILINIIQILKMDSLQDVRDISKIRN